MAYLGSMVALLIFAWSYLRNNAS